jgi:hypothetical protein
MSLLPNSILPKNFKRTEGSIRVSPRLRRIAAGDQADVFAEPQTGENGLVEAEGRSRLDEYGSNAVRVDQRFTRLKLFIKACLNPLVILLSVLATITFVTDQSGSDVTGWSLDTDYGGSRCLVSIFSGSPRRRSGSQAQGDDSRDRDCDLRWQRTRNPFGRTGAGRRSSTCCG